MSSIYKHLPVLSTFIRKIRWMVKDTKLNTLPMGGIIVKYFPECYQFDEVELNQILRTALATEECQQIIQNIKSENAKNLSQNMMKHKHTGGNGANG